jgi:hypothetical protein
MAVKRRRSKHRAGLSADQLAWLAGDRNCGFIEFLPDAQLRALWDEYGDKEKMVWQEGDTRPVAI